MKNFMNPETVAKIYDEEFGNIISVTFIKRTTGEERTLVGRAGVRKYVKGTGMSYSPKAMNLLSIYDMQLAASLPEAEKAKAYRVFPIDSVLSMAAGGKFYKGK